MFWTYSNIYLLINVIIWLLTFLLHQKYVKSFNVGSFVLLLYLSIAIVAFHLYNNELAKGYFEELTLFPFIYLYFAVMIVSYPVLKLNEGSILEIEYPSQRSFNIIATLIIIAAFAQIGTIFSDFTDGLSKMLVSDTGGSELYNEMIEENYDKAGDGQIRNVAAIITNSFDDITIFFLIFSFTFKEKNKFIILGLSLSFILTILSSIANGTRGGAVNMLMIAFVSFVLLRHFMSKKIQKLIKTVGIVLAFLISIPIMIITISRFKNSDDFTTLFSMEWYYAQSILYFNNHGLDAGGIRNGDRTASLFKQIIWDDVPKNYIERIERYSHMSMNESIFSTFVGEFTLDYGPYLTLLLFISLFFIFKKKVKVYDGKIKFFQLLLIFFLICITVNGAIGLFPFSDVGGNLSLIVFVLLYFWFRYDYLKGQIS